MSGGSIITLSAHRRLILANNSPTLTAAGARAVDNPANHPHDSETHKQGANMSDITVTKDWADRRLSEIDGKIELEKTKSELQFDRLFREMQLEHKAALAHVDARFAQIDTQIARSETNLTRWIMGLIFSILSFVGTYYFKAKETSSAPIAINTGHETTQAVQPADSAPNPVSASPAAHRKKP